MEQHHKSNHDRLDQCLNAVNKTSDIRARSALWKMYTNVRKTWVEMDQEMVQCRRAKRLTPKYKELESKLTTYIAEFEQWLTMAALLYA
jgi:hypothetical protein